MANTRATRSTARDGEDQMDSTRPEDRTKLLRRILARERERGHDDRAVMGGMDALVESWKGSLGRSSGLVAESALSGALAALGGYSRCSIEVRAQHLEAALACLDGRVADAVHLANTAVTSGQRRAAGPVDKDVRPRPRSPGARRSTSESPARSLGRQGTGVDADVRAVWGISDAFAARLKRLGIHTVADLLYHLPRRYVDYGEVKHISELTAGEAGTIQAVVWEARTVQGRGRLSVTTALVGDDTGTIQAIWFNQPYVARSLPAGRTVVLSGKIHESFGRLQFRSPDWEIPGDKGLVHTGRLVPKYPLTEGVTDRWLRSIMHRALLKWIDALPEPLPPRVRDSHGLLSLAQALPEAHFPSDQPSLRASLRRLAFEELFVLQLAVALRRREFRETWAAPLAVDESVVSAFLRSLPFSLTEGQSQALSEILEDLRLPTPMTRLLQGDVGSGKTVVACAAALVAVNSGLQAAIMAPTEILAEQHFRTIGTMLGAIPEEGGNQFARIANAPCAWRSSLRLCLLTSSARKSERQRIVSQLAAGEIDMAIGTHALIEEAVVFARLGLVVVDEQHRFGVMQRTHLRGKASTPHLLVMTATPIPRSLALTLYGDLDVSVIRHLPPGRLEIKTMWLDPDDRAKAYEFVSEQVRSGRQAYVVCPLVEESDAIESKAAVAEFQRLQSEVFPTLRVGLLHGRMKGRDKDAVMRCFKEGELDVLVATAVIEVGIDVPNATVMLIESADRFGLAQLHQFRGRVGRGAEQSYCLLLADSPSSGGERRLAAITRSQSGFELAEADLQLRGPGEFFGTRQSGLPEMRVAQLSDMATLEEAREAAKALLAAEPSLASADCGPLRDRVSRFLARCAESN